MKCTVMVETDQKHTEYIDLIILSAALSNHSRHGKYIALDDVNFIV